MEKKARVAGFAEIAVNVPGVVDVFDYDLTETLEGAPGVGWLAEVPFGSQQVQGIILKIKDASEVLSTKPISQLLSQSPVVTPAQIDLAKWMAQAYFRPLSEYLFFMLPPGLGQRADSLYELNLGRLAQGKELSPVQKRIVNLLQEKGALRGRQLDVHLRAVDWRTSARTLARQGVLSVAALLPEPSARAKQVRVVRAALHPKDAPELASQMGRLGSAAAARRMTAWQLLADEPGVVDVSWLYAAAGVNMADLRWLEKKGALQFEGQQVWRDPLAGKQVSPERPPELTEDQAIAWARLRQLWLDGSTEKPVLLHGVTGSGKTELYLRLIAEVTAAGRQALMLVPEISMTPQTIERFLQRFPGRVGVVHSKLSPGERYDTWRRAQRGDFAVVIGARSALFTPLPNLGAVILDECHDDSYTQTETGPYYHAQGAAIALGKLSGALVLLGSATPNVATYFAAQYAHWPLLELPRRIQAHGRPVSGSAGVQEQPLPEVAVVDMRSELKSGNTSMFSRALLQGLERVLEARQQAILLLNRRGSATYVFCRDCGESLRCPRCEIPLIYHRGAQALLCHTCGYKRGMPQRCPKCQSSRIKQYGAGTEKVEAELHAAFPQARLLRWDADSARGKGSDEVILAHFREQRADFLVGTQMLAKGLDLPLVTLVGIVLADSGLNFPDYRTAERAFQLFTQVAGRSGRSARGGKVILQTFQPEHYAIQFAARHDYAGFYLTELEQRRRLEYPPFTRLVRLEARDRSSDAARRRAQALVDDLKAFMRQSADKTLSVTEALPPFFARQAGQYRWQVILKGGQPGKALREIDLRGLIVEVDPPSLL